MEPYRVEGRAEGTEQIIYKPTFTMSCVND